MKNIISKFALLLIALFFTVSIIGCNEDESILTPNDNIQTDQSALEKIVEEDETLQSFDLNYDEEEVMDFVLGKTAVEIFPVKVGQRMKLVEKTLDIVFEGETATGVLTKTFEGVLFIVASLEPIEGEVDEVDLNVYEKPFRTTITRNIIFEKIANTDSPRKNWKMSAISLPVGGTLTENISIEKVVVYLPNGETLNIESPLDYYLSRGPSLRRLIPVIAQFEEVSVEVTIKSIYEDADFVTLTSGAVRTRKDSRFKSRLELVREDPSDGTYTRVYQGNWVIRQFKGYRHAVINAIPYNVLKDSEFPVESKSWGIPYFVN